MHCWRLSRLFCVSHLSVCELFKKDLTDMSEIVNSPCKKNKFTVISHLYSGSVLKRACFDVSKYSVVYQCFLLMLKPQWKTKFFWTLWMSPVCHTRIPLNIHNTDVTYMTWVIIYTDFYTTLYSLTYTQHTHTHTPTDVSVWFHSSQILDDHPAVLDRDMTEVLQ